MGIRKVSSPGSYGGDRSAGFSLQTAITYLLLIAIALALYSLAVAPQPAQDAQLIACERGGGGAGCARLRKGFVWAPESAAGARAGGGGDEAAGGGAAAGQGGGEEQPGAAGETEAERAARREADQTSDQSADEKRRQAGAAADAARRDDARPAEEAAARAREAEAAATAKREQERKAKEEAERKREAEEAAKREEERKAKEEAERKAKEEAERKAKEEAERRAKEEQQQQAAKEEEERKRTAEAAQPQPQPAQQQQQQQQQQPDGECHAEENADYGADRVVKEGRDHLMDSAAACCAACRAFPSCNMWTWCGKPGGCGNGGHKECWLKRQEVIDYEAPLPASRGKDIPWTAGAVYTEAQAAAWKEADKARLRKLKEDPELPLVYMDVAINGTHIGRVEVVLFVKEAPRCAENFRQLFTGERGAVPKGREGEGKNYTMAGAKFYRIEYGFICQTGAWTESVFGGHYKDDPGGLKLKHDRKGLLSMANTGPDTNDSHLSFMANRAPWLDGKHTIFGEVVEGYWVLQRVQDLAKATGSAKEHAGAVITATGQIRRGSWTPNLEQM